MNFTVSQHLPVIACSLLGWIGICLPGLGQSITAAPDGTQTQVTQSGNLIQIEGGTQAGSNLFHSFEQFNVQQGQIANFLSNPSISNILGRITGGSASLIDGQLQITGSNANLFLMNPAGMIFGAHASLNLPASFTATTANAIGIGGGWFNATGPNSYSALSGSPNSFAFTSANPGALFNGGNLTVTNGQSVTLLGGTVLNTGTIAAPGGRVTIVAIPSEKLVQITPEGSLLSLVLPLETQVQLNSSNITPLSLPELLTGNPITSATGVVVEQGVVKLVSNGVTLPTDAGTAIASGQISVAQNGTGQGGQVQVLGDRVGVVQGQLDASGHQGGGTILIGGDYQGKGTVPTAQITGVTADSTLKADALQSGDGGKVIVWSDLSTQLGGTISARGGFQGGNGGLVETSGKAALAVFSGGVNASAVQEQAGNWFLSSADITIATVGNGTLSGGIFDPGNSSAIAPAIIATALDNGTHVTLTTASGSGGNGDITLANSINQVGGGAASLTLTGRQFATANGATISMNSTGGLTFNLNQVNPETNAPTSSIQSAVDAIGTLASSSTINLGAGTYRGNTLFIHKSLTLNGSGVSSTILNGNNTYQVINVSTDDIFNLNKLTITGGQSLTQGSGIYNANSTLNIDSINLSGNFTSSSGASGSGIYNLSGKVTINNSTFSGNSALSSFVFNPDDSVNSGGDIYNETGTVIIHNTTFSNSKTDRGGNIYNSGILIISNASLSNSSGRYQGGSIYNSGSLIINNSNIFDNLAAYNGGGIYNTGSLSILNSTVSNNSAIGNGGGIYSTNTLNIKNTTISNNLTSY